MGATNGGFDAAQPPAKAQCYLPNGVSILMPKDPSFCAEPQNLASR